MADITTLVSKVRLELGDTGKSFVVQFVADGTTNRFNIHYSPLDATQVYVTLNGVNVTSTTSVEESSGVLVFDTVPADGAEIQVSGLFYRYFTAAELGYLVESALAQHAAKHTDSLGRMLTVENLPTIEEYPVVVYATSLALYTLATDSSFDIDIMAPDGVNIPRSERYRQLMEMMTVRKAQYQELCVHLGIGMFSIDIFSLRRISKATGRFVPLYTPQEVDDRSHPQRVDTPPPTYGDKPIPWPTDGGELTAYQGRAFSTSIVVNGNYAGKSFVANLLAQRGSVLVVQRFTLSVATTGTDVITAAARTAGSTTVTLTTSAAHGLTTGNSVAITNVSATVDGIYTIGNATPTGTTFTIVTTATTALALTGLTGQVATNVAKDYTFTLSLTADQTLRIAERTYWSIQLVDPENTDYDSGTILPVEIKGGKFFTARVRTAIL
jgi:hypothetical protein